MAQFKVGDKVRVRKWEDMVKEHGMVSSGNHIRPPEKGAAFVFPMRTLCGAMAKIKRIDGNDVELTEWDINNYGSWSFSPYMLEPVKQPPISQEIHITSDGLTTHAVLKQGGKVVKRAKAVCNEKDTFDFFYGAGLAFSRIVTGLSGASAAKPAVKEVRRPAKVGEYIKTVKDGYLFNSGRIIHVQEIDKYIDAEKTRINNYFYFSPSDYVVLEGYTG